MNINILLPYKEKFTKDKASSVSITISNNFKYSNFKKNIFIYGQFVEKPMFSKNFVGIKKSWNFLKSKNLHNASEMCKKINDHNNSSIIEVHNRPYLIEYIKSRLKLSHVLTLFLHNDPLEMKGSRTIKERLNLISSTDKIYCVSKYIKNRFLEGISDDEKKVVVLYNGVNRNIKKPPKKKKIIIFVGRIVPEKGVHLFKDAIKEIYELTDKWKFMIIGSPKLGIKNFDNFSKKIKIDFEHLGPRAKMIGFVNATRIHKIMQESSIIVIPSIWNEPFGLVAAEAMSNGLAIISSKVGGLSEIIGNNGILINDIDAKKISNSLLDLITNDKLLEKYQKKSWNNFNLYSQKISLVLDRHRESLFLKD